MSGAREEILARVRGALRDVPDAERPDDVPLSRSFRRESAEPQDALVDRFVRRVQEYHADAMRLPAGEATAAVTEACRRQGLSRLVVPAALPSQWRPEGVELLDGERLSAAELDAVDGAITGCATAIAETGTLVLDGQGACGTRAITLVPDHHICVVRAEQVRGSVPEAIAVLAPAVTGRGVPVTFVSGPSASSDIELSRVEGVHGPRHLLVLVLDGTSF